MTELREWIKITGAVVLVMFAAPPLFRLWFWWMKWWGF